jgi:hypothetical protein
MLFTKTLLDKHSQSTLLPTSLRTNSTARSTDTVNYAKPLAISTITAPVADKAWQLGIGIEGSNKGHASNAHIAMDSRGRAIAVWASYDGLRYSIWVNRYTYHTGWSDAVQIDSDDAISVYNPNVVVNEEGQGVVVWSQYDGTYSSVWASYYNPAEGWSPACNINPVNLDGDAELPQAAIDAHGNVTIVWRRYESAQRSIWATRYTRQGGWDIAQLIENDPFGDAEDACIVTDAIGRCTAVWRRCSATQRSIWTNHYRPGFGWGQATSMAPEDTADAYDLQLSTNQHGAAMLVWRQTDGNHRSIWASNYQPQDGWSMPTTIVTDTSCNAVEPHVAMQSSGCALAVWRQSNTNQCGIWANQFQPGAGWGVATLIGSTRKGTACKPRASMSDGGSAMVVWLHADELRQAIWANHFLPASGWGTPIRLKARSNGEADWPEVVTDAYGNAIALWQQGGNLRQNICATAYR